jgi:hypothetical protein
MAVTRLFVGGLQPECTSSDLQSRFSGFNVQRTEVAVAKAGGAGCRGFGYVELELRDEKDLARCIRAVREAVAPDPGATASHTPRPVGSTMARGGAAARWSWRWPSRPS